MSSGVNINPDASPMPDLPEDASAEVDEFKTQVSLVEYVIYWTGLLFVVTSVWYTRKRMMLSSLLLEVENIRNLSVYLITDEIDG